MVSTPDASELLRTDAEKKLREAAKDYKQTATAESLDEVERQALRMIFHAPERSAEAVKLLKELL